MRIIIKDTTPKEPEGERECLSILTTGTLKWTPMGWEVNGDADLSGIGLEKIPYRFHRVRGDFDVSKNSLVSLEGSPRFAGHFFAHSNRLTSLIGGPEISGHFIVYQNCLTNLTGAPKAVKKDFDASSNELVSIRGIPRKIGGGLNLFMNRNLSSLEGFPDAVMGSVYFWATSIPRVESIPGVRGRIFWD